MLGRSYKVDNREHEYCSLCENQPTSSLHPRSAGLACPYYNRCIILKQLHACAGGHCMHVPGGCAHCHQLARLTSLPSHLVVWV